MKNVAKVVTLLLTSILILTFEIRLTIGEVTEYHISVPHHYQSRSYYCGPAALEMVFDFYGPDINQLEIADAARTIKDYGTSFSDMRRAAHFSNLSVSKGDEAPWEYMGYSIRKLGYAAFEAFNITLSELKNLIAAGYPIIVATRYSQEYPYGHYRVIVGFNQTHIIFHDPWPNPPYRGPNGTVSYSLFLDLWQDSNYWGLFVSP